MSLEEVSRTNDVTEQKDNAGEGEKDNDEEVVATAVIDLNLVGGFLSCSTPPPDEDERGAKGGAANEGNEEKKGADEEEGVVERSDSLDGGDTETRGLSPASAKKLFDQWSDITRSGRQEWQEKLMMPVCALGTGHFFGHEALVKGAIEPVNTFMQTSSVCKFHVLRASSVALMVDAHPALMKRMQMAMARAHQKQEEVLERYLRRSEEHVQEFRAHVAMGLSRTELVKKLQSMITPLEELELAAQAQHEETGCFGQDEDADTESHHPALSTTAPPPRS